VFYVVLYLLSSLPFYSHERDFNYLDNIVPRVCIYILSINIAACVLSGTEIAGRSPWRMETRWSRWLFYVQHMTRMQRLQRQVEEIDCRRSHSQQWLLASSTSKLHQSWATHLDLDIGSLSYSTTFTTPPGHWRRRVLLLKIFASKTGSHDLHYTTRTLASTSTTSQDLRLQNR
jgi:hypothetical protein